MIINEKLFNDLFLESHKSLTIKCLQTLNSCENLLILKGKDDLVIEELRIIDVNDSIYTVASLGMEFNPKYFIAVKLDLKYVVSRTGWKPSLIYCDRFYSSIHYPFYTKNITEDYVKIIFYL